MQNPKIALRLFSQLGERLDDPGRRVFLMVNSVGLALGAIACLGESVMAAALTGWRYDAQANQLEVMVDADTTPKYFLMAQPARIILDLPNTDMGSVQVKESYTGAVRHVRVSQFQPGVTRIVLELSPEVSLAPGQVKLEQAKAEAGGDRWVLRPLIVQAGNTATAPTPGNPSDQPAPRVARVTPTPNDRELPVESMPSLPQVPAMVKVPASSTPAVAPAPRSTEVGAIAEVPPASTAMPELPPPPPITLPTAEQTPDAPASEGQIPSTTTLPKAVPEVKATDTPSTLVIPAKPVAPSPVPGAIGSDFSAVTTEPPPENTLSITPPARSSVAQLPPQPTTPLPPVEDPVDGLGVDTSHSIHLSVPPPISLPGQSSSRGPQVVVPTTNTTSTPVETTAPIADGQTSLRPARPSSSVIVPTDSALPPTAQSGVKVPTTEAIAPAMRQPASVEIPSTFNVLPSASSQIQVPPPAPLDGTASPVMPRPLDQVPAPMSVPPLQAPTGERSPTPLAQPPISSVMQGSKREVLESPATAIAMTPPVVLPTNEPTPMQPPISSVIQAPGSSGMQSYPAPAVMPPLAPTAQRSETVQVPASGVMQGAAPVGVPPSSVLQAPGSSVLQPSVSGVLQAPGSSVLPGPAAPMPQPPVSSVLQAPGSSVMQGSVGMPSSVLQAPPASILQPPSGSVSLPSTPAPTALPPVALTSDQAAMITVPPLQPLAAPTNPSGAPVTVPPLQPVTPSVGAAPTVEFGQPLPTTGAATLGTVPRSLPNVAPTPSWQQTYFQSARPGTILPAGASLSLTYPGATAVTLEAGTARQEVLLLQTEVRDTMGNVVFPRGSYVTGQFDTDRNGSKFTARAISMGDRSVPFYAESAPLGNGSRELDPASMALFSGAGALAGGLVSQFSGWGLLLGGAAGAATGYLTAPKPTVLEPGQIIRVEIKRDLP